MQCALDVELTPEIIHQSDSVLTALLAKASPTVVDASLDKFRIKQSSIVSKTSKATLAAEADGLDAKHGVWLLADPVHLVLQRDAFSLYPEVPVKLSLDEAHQYQTVLNQHFKADGIVFYIGHSGQWYVNANGQSELAQFDGLGHPHHAVGQSVDDFLPKNAEENQWLQILNEIQMLLFDCEQNQLRAQAGQVAVNSVWFHGAGIVEGANEKVSGLHLFSDSAFYHGLAAHNGSKSEALPTATMFEKSVAQYGAETIILDLSQLAALEQWLSLCQHLLKQRVIDHLRLNLGLSDRTLVADIKPLDHWRFWRKSKPVRDYL